MGIKKFFKTLSLKISAADIFMMIISAIVGVLFSLYPSNIPQEFWWIKIVILSVYLSVVIAFLALVIWLKNKKEKFDYVYMIEKAYKNEQWKDVFTVGYPVLRSLWTLSKVSLVIHIARMVEEAVEQIDESVKEINNIPFNKLKIQAELRIDSLGYANYVLGNKEQAIRYIKSGMAIINDLQSISKIQEEERLIILLRVYRHLLAVVKPDDGESDEIVQKLKGYVREAKKYDAGNNDLRRAELSAQYVLQKHCFKTNGEYDKTIEVIENLKEEFSALDDEDWVQKCELFIWQIKLKEFGYNDNIKNQIRRLINSKTVSRRKFLKVVDVYFSYQIENVITCGFSDKKSGMILLDDLQNEIKKIEDVADDFANQSEDLSTLDKYEEKKSELHRTIKNKIKTVKKKK